MGMDLKPINPTADAPKDSDGDFRWGRHNWTGWSELVDLLQSWEVDTREFAGTNDGYVISAETCLKVADALEKNLPSQPQDIQDWLQPKIILWRTCGGYEQW